MHTYLLPLPALPILCTAASQQTRTTTAISTESFILRMLSSFAASASGRELDLEHDRLLNEQAESSDTADVEVQKGVLTASTLPSIHLTNTTIIEQSGSAVCYATLASRSSFSVSSTMVGKCIDFRVCEVLIVPAVLYVIILSAALDLVPPSTPKGIIAFCNIAPALAAKIGWPYVLKGRIRYAKRLIGCCILSMSGMLVSIAKLRS